MSIVDTNTDYLLDVVKPHELIDYAQREMLSFSTKIDVQLQQTQRYDHLMLSSKVLGELAELYGNSEGMFDVSLFGTKEVAPTGNTHDSTIVNQHCHSADDPFSYTWNRGSYYLVSPLGQDDPSQMHKENFAGLSNWAE